MLQDPDHRGDLVRTLSNVARGRMQAMPRHVSLGCTLLVARALVRDVERRITLRDMANDVWLRETSALVGACRGITADNECLGSRTWMHVCSG